MCVAERVRLAVRLVCQRVQLCGGRRGTSPSAIERARRQLEPLAPLSPSLTPSASPMGGVPPLADMRSPSSGAQGGAAGFSPRPAAGVLPRMQAAGRGDARRGSIRRTSQLRQEDRRAESARRTSGAPTCVGELRVA